MKRTLDIANHTSHGARLSLVMILLLAFMLRTHDIANNPPGFFVDEATHGLDAYSVWHTGKDYHKAVFPIFFKETGEYRSPVWIYFSAPIIGIIGKSIESVRFSSALQGVISILLIYFVTKELYTSKSAGLISAFILTISPWHIFMSRIGFEIVTYVMTSLMCILLLFRSRHSARFTPTIFLGCIISFFSYTVARITTPLVFMLFICTHWYVVKTWLRQKMFWIWLTLTASIFVYLLVFYAPSDSFFSRWKQVRPEKMRIETVITGYVNHFTADFLITKGDVGFLGQNIYRHSYWGIGQIYLFQLVCMILGLCFGLIHHSLRRATLFLIGCLLIFPIGSAIVSPLPHATRSAIGLIPFTILSAYGLYYALCWSITGRFRHWILRMGISLVLVTWILYSFSQFIPRIEAYKKDQRSSSWDGWQYGYISGITTLSKYAQQYDELIITHRFSSNSFLFAFFNVGKICPKCRGMKNPITIDLHGKKQLFALRDSDLDEAARIYPYVKFHEIDSVVSPAGVKELKVGYFQ